MDAPREGAHIFALDLSSGSRSTISGTSDAPRALALVRAGMRTIDVCSGTPDEVEQASAGLKADDPRSQRAWPSDLPLPDATVVMCTTGTCDVLREAVIAVLAQDVEDFEFLVVDNAPSTGATREALKGISDPRLRIIDAPRAGLSHARNRGVLNARGAVIAFTDDDAFVDRYWLRALLEPFAADPAGSIGATTGIILAAEMETPAQRWFESRGGFPKDVVPRLWATHTPDSRLAGFADSGEGGPLYPYTTARVGAGVCMAFRADALRKCGPFDTTLGAGTLTRAGEDHDMFARLLRDGWVILHTPDAVVYHRHRSDVEGLHQQIRGNGSGMAALLTKSVIEHPCVVFDLLTRIPAVGRRLAPGSVRVAGSDPDLPSSVTKIEVRGFLEGPLLFIRSRWQHRRRAGTRRDRI